VLGLNVGLPFKSAPVYAISGAHRVPPICDVPYAIQSSSNEHMDIYESRQSRTANKNLHSVASSITSVLNV
jgi:hypothetical protein